MRATLAALIAGGMVVTAAPAVDATHQDPIRGKAVYYSNAYAGETMACGGKYQPWKMVAAHRRLPCGTELHVRNRANGRVVKVTVRDRGPYGDKDVKLDLSRRAARKLRFIKKGVTRIRAVRLH